MELAPDILPPPLPDELLVIRNPVSANSHRAHRQITDLQERFPFSSIDVYPTLHDDELSSSENHQANQQRVLDLLQERTNPNQPQARRLWLVIATGDGTIRDIGEALLGADEAIRDVPILPLAGGNGNDLSSMVHGFWGKRRPAQQMGQACIKPVHPLEWTFQQPDGSTKTRYAQSYGSVGELVAKTAKEIDDVRGHSKLVHLVHEKVLGAKALVTATRTTVEERGSKHETVELIFSNGPRMAKFLRWDQKLHDPQFMRTEVIQNDRLHLAASGIKMMLAKHRSTPVPDGNMVRFQTLTDTWVQLDGEATPLAAHSTVTVRRSPLSLNIVHLK